MTFPGARRLVCTKRVTQKTQFLEKFDANDKEICMCLYVSGTPSLPEETDYMKKDTSIVCPEDSVLLAEYLLKDEPIRVQIKRYQAPIASLAAPENCVGRLRK